MTISGGFRFWFLEAAVVFFGSFVEIYIFSILEACRSSSRLPVPPRGIIVLTMQVWSGLFRQINIYQFSHRRPYGWWRCSGLANRSVLSSIRSILGFWWGSSLVELLIVDPCLIHRLSGIRVPALYSWIYLITFNFKFGYLVAYLYFKWASNVCGRLILTLFSPTRDLAIVEFYLYL